MASKRAFRALVRSNTLERSIYRPTAFQHVRIQSSSSSTSALAYKALHRRISPLPLNDSPSSWSAPAAVSSILYETPLPSQAPPTRHVLNCLVQNEPGVLSRVSGILAARGFNIDSLVVCNTEVEDLSRMTIVLQGLNGVVEQARRQLEDLVPVWAVLDYTAAPLVQRELLLAKISILGPEYFEEVLAHHREITSATAEAESEQAALEEKQQAVEENADWHRQDFHPSKLATSQALRHKHEHLEAVTHLTHQFGGKVLDISNNNCIVEVSAKPTRIDSFMKLIAPFGILESTRTGKLNVLLKCVYFADLDYRTYGTAQITTQYPRRGARERSPGRRRSKHTTARLKHFHYRIFDRRCDRCTGFMSGSDLTLVSHRFGCPVEVRSVSSQHLATRKDSIVHFWGSWAEPRLAICAAIAFSAGQLLDDTFLDDEAFECSYEWSV